VLFLSVLLFVQDEPIGDTVLLIFVSEPFFLLLSLHMLVEECTVNSSIALRWIHDPFVVDEGCWSSIGRRTRCDVLSDMSWVTTSFRQQLMT
jgi:hypothetical protein